MSKNTLSKVVLQKFRSFISLDDLPEDLKISTITTTFTLETKFNTENIGKYIDLSNDRIVTVKYGRKDANHTRTLIKPKETKRKKKKKAKKIFFNQTSVIIKSKNEKTINVKLFKNGSVQMTGCNNMENCTRALSILFEELKKGKAIVDPKTTNKIIEKPFVDDINKLGMENINNLKIVMINSNFNVGFRIDRDKLYGIMLKKNIESTFEPCVHACVNIKYMYKRVSKISIFVFTIF